MKTTRHVRAKLDREKDTAEVTEVVKVDENLVVKSGGEEVRVEGVEVEGETEKLEG